MQQLDRTFTALSDPTRRAILSQLMQDECALSQLAEPYAMSLTAVSKHIKVLAGAGLVSIEKRGRTQYCRLEAGPMAQASEWINHYQKFWTQQFDALAQFVGADADDSEEQK